MPEQPNIILIMTDQQRGDCLGIDGHPVLQTPNLDYLARSGTRFRRGYAECPVCIPARRTVMSGAAPAAHGLVGMQSKVPWEPAHTLPGELKKAGYHTYLSGKLHLHPDRKRYGFDHMQWADMARGEENDYTQWLRQVHHRNEVHPGAAHGISSNGWVGRPHNLPEEQTLTFWCMDRAMEFLEKRDPSCPFFLKISMVDPHPPFTPPAPYYERYINRDLPEPVVGDWAKGLFKAPEKGLNPDAWYINLSKDDMQCARAAYYGMINFIDDQIGRLIQFDKPTIEESLVIFVSDHGEMLGDHHHFRKTYPYEASARVPFLIRAPKSWKLPAEVVTDGPVGLQDIMPTCLDAAGLDIPETCTGKSLLPVMRGEKDRVRDVLHGEHAKCFSQNHSNHFITDGRYKYIWFSHNGREQLFDLKNDPDETRDLVLKKDAPKKLAPWRKKMIEILKDRPEGFTDGRKLIAGKVHGNIVPGYEPDKTFKFV